jgi:hypothetical protein
MAVPTLTVKEQDCPPTVMAKLAMPAEAGVPEMVKFKDPAPLIKTP